MRKIKVHHTETGLGIQFFAPYILLVIRIDSQRDISHSIGIHGKIQAGLDVTAILRHHPVNLIRIQLLRQRIAHLRPFLIHLLKTLPDPINRRVDMCKISGANADQEQGQHYSQCDKYPLLIFLCLRQIRLYRRPERTYPIRHTLFLRLLLLIQSVLYTVSSVYLGQTPFAIGIVPLRFISHFILILSHSVHKPLHFTLSHNGNKSERSALTPVLLVRSLY